MTQDTSARRSGGPARPGRYFLSFVTTAFVLGGLTLFLVLVVLPRRYVLSSGLQESGVSFPTEAAPFVPPEEFLTQPPPPPPPEPEPVRGPTELFWADVTPLLDAEEYRVAVPRFQRYLTDYPEDWNVLREYAITLQRAGQEEAALGAYERLLSGRDDPGDRLLFARALRDQNRLDEASAQYQLLLEGPMRGPELALEWGKALAWAMKYDEAVRVLGRGLDQDPTSIDLRIALAQAHYWSGSLDEADRVLAETDLASLEEAGGLSLKREIVAALTPPEPEVQPDPVRPLTTRQRIALAQVTEDPEEASELLHEVLQEDPEDIEAWKAYADLLQFKMEELELAREALRTVEGLGGADSALEFRLAQLEIWTGRNGQATDRLQSLLRSLQGVSSADIQESVEPTPAPVDLAEVHALLGDLERYRGDRVASGESYEAALVADSSNARAKEGLEELETLLQGEIQDRESPGGGANVSSLSDSDDFFSLEVAAEGKEVSRPWVWGLKTGRRWLGGFDLAGAERRDQGYFVEAESARWWRWGTIRTGIQLGVEEVVAGQTDVFFGASLHFSELKGFRADFRYRHGPAYPLTSTLQSVYSGVVQDRVTANFVRELGRRWSLSLAGDGAWLKSTDLPGFGDGQSGSLRLEAAASLGRSLTDDFILGFNGRAVRYSEASPVLDDLRLFWDPRAVLVGGIYAQWNRDLGETFAVRARFNPSLAFIDERTTNGFQTVPHLAAEVGFSHQGSRFETNLDGFYYQGRFDGYRAYGVRIFLSARNWLRKEEER